MNKILLVTPPFLQVNAPYPANPYLKGYLSGKGIDCQQFDLSIETIGTIFSRGWIEQLFDSYDGRGDENITRIYILRRRYAATVDTVITFLRGGDPGLANLICAPDFLPMASRFDSMVDIETAFGSMGIVDCAKYLSTLYLQDLSDFIRATVSPHFEIVKYGEKIASSLPEFDAMQQELDKPLNMVEKTMIELLDGEIKKVSPRFVGFTIPFPGNLLSALRCAQHIKQSYPHIATIAGGGYPSTELRHMSDRSIFDYFDYLSLDDGELSLERIITGGDLIRTYTKDRFHDSAERVSHLERGCPDYSGLPHGRYFSLLETINPMHRLWGDGRWNKMTLAHGCYWAKCAFCDTAVDYIKCYDTVQASTLADWMDTISNETGSLSFHFTDEAAAPKLLRDLSLELLRRGRSYSWWTNIRFESAFTGDLCRLMASAGCIAIAGGLETASNRLLEKIDKGVTIEQAAIAMRNLYYSGIMVHTYLMYGFPTQTLQESVDSLEVVRQMFRADLIGSAFWHRYAMTIHSPSGQDPEKYGVRLKSDRLNPFANNEIYFVENRGYNINLVGDALREAVANYMAGEEIARPVNRWFAGKAPQTTIENSLITDQLIKPDSSRIFNPAARLVWTGSEVRCDDQGIWITTLSGSEHLKFTPADAAFLARLTELCSDLSRRVTFGEIKELYAELSDEPFLTLYHSKKWDRLRGYGLLQL